MIGKNYNIFYLSWLNNSNTVLDLVRRFPDLQPVELKNSVAETLFECAELSTTPYFWVTSSLADYQRFNFNDYNEIGFEPYLQVFGSSTWFASKYYFEQLPTDSKYVDALPNLHFVNDNRIKSL